MNAQPRAQGLQGGGAVGRAIVNDKLDGYATPEQCLFEHPFDVQRRLAQAKGAVSEQARGIVKERDQVGLAQLPIDGQTRAVHHIAVPDGAGELGAKAALLLGQTDRPSDA